MGGGLLLLVIVVSLGLVSRYRRKFLEGKASNDDDGDGDRDDHNKEVDDIDIKDNDDDFYKKKTGLNDIPAQQSGPGTQFHPPSLKGFFDFSTSEDLLFMLMV